MTDRAVELVKQAQFQLGQAYPDYQVLRTLEELHTYLLEQGGDPVTEVATQPVAKPVADLATSEPVSEPENTRTSPHPTFLPPSATAEEVKAFVRAKRDASLPSDQPAVSSEPSPPKRRGRPPRANPPGHALPNV